MILTQIIYKKVDVTMALNGALAGLVSITAEPLTPAAGGHHDRCCRWCDRGVHVPLLDKLKIDDVVGAIPVHLLAGIWGTFIVPLSNVIWFILKSTVGIRATEEQEMMGMDMAEVGVEAYPEFTKG
jgi:Amt family ammonium transporter